LNYLHFPHHYPLLNKYLTGYNTGNELSQKHWLAFQSPPVIDPVAGYVELHPWLSSPIACTIGIGITFSEVTVVGVDSGSTEIRVPIKKKE
jgi:hypothetical protein